LPVVTFDVNVGSGQIIHAMLH